MRKLKGKKGHESSRLKLCLRCLRAEKSVRPISDGNKAKIEQVYGVIDWESPSVPLGICSNCRNDVKKESEKGQTRDSLFEFSLFEVPQNLSPQTLCPCRICNIVHPGEHLTKEELREINPLGELPLNKPGRKRKEPEVESEVEQDSPDFFGPPGPPVLKCERCDAVVEEGKKHQCSKREFRERLIEKVTVAHPKSGAMAAAAVVKSKASSPKGTKYLPQAKGGRHLPINIGHVPDTDSPKIASSNINAMQKELRLSNEGRKNLVTLLNASTGHRLVEAGARENLSKLVHEILEFFTSTHIVVEGKSYKVTHVMDLDSFIWYVLQKRGLNLSDVIVRVSQDGGQGSLKISMNLIDCTVDMTDVEAHQRKTRRLGEFKDSGVERIFVLAKVDRLHESHESFQRLLELVNPGEIPYTNAVDYKAGNMLAGIQSAMSKHSCLFCTAVNDRGRNGLSEMGDMRTIKRVSDMFKKWHADAKGNPNKKDLQYYENCCHEPILKGKPGDWILSHIAPDELHLLLGITEYLIKRISFKWEDEVHDWLLRIGVGKNEYHNFEYNGHACQLIVDNVDSLQHRSQLCAKFEKQSLINTLRVFGKVVHSCFGMQLREGWKASIREFQDSWEQLILDYADTEFHEDEPKIMFTEKVHVVVFHVQQFCERYGALGPWSTQAGESLHSRLKKHAANYDNAPKHLVDDRDLWAIADFNAKAI